MLNMVDTGRKFVAAKLQAAKWDSDPHSMAQQRAFVERSAARVGKAKGKKANVGQHPSCHE